MATFLTTVLLQKKIVASKSFHIRLDLVVGVVLALLCITSGDAFLARQSRRHHNSLYITGGYRQGQVEQKDYAFIQSSHSAVQLSENDVKLQQQQQQQQQSLQRPQRRLEQCVCLVTGASRGIGKGIAIELGRQGAIVYVTGTSSMSSSLSMQEKSQPFAILQGETGPGTIEETAKLVDQAGGIGIAVYCNHGIDHDVQNLMDRIDQDYGRLDILVNNAFRIPKGGVEQLNKKFWQLNLECWDAMHQVGLRSHFVASSYAMTLLQKSRSSKVPCLPRPIIAMIGSFGGLSYTFNVPYGVGKAGVDRLVKDMAIELNDEDICVVSFWPGVVVTERTNSTVASGDWDKYVGVPLDNAETPSFTGKAIVSVACDPHNMRKSGSYQVVAELAQEYDFYDNIHGQRPPSIRSLRFLLPSYAMDKPARRIIPQWVIPDWKIPFWVMALGRPPKPGDSSAS